MRYLLFVILFYTFQCPGQNLVPNPSFEGYNPCGSPNIICKTIDIVGGTCKSSCCSWALPQSNIINSATYNWSAYSYVPPYYFNACSVNQWKESYGTSSKDPKWYKPRTGNAFIIISTFDNWYTVDTREFRQYAQVKLTAPLQAGCIYDISSYALLLRNFDPIFTTTWGNLIPNAADGLGIYLSKDSLFMTDISQHLKPLDSLTPQVSNPDGHLLEDSLEYQKISGTYKAAGGEQWLIIGNFKNNAQTHVAGNKAISRAFYAIDDVSVESWRPNLISFADTIVCSDTPLPLKLPDGLSDIKWSTGETTQQITISTAGTYTVEASNGCEILHDQFTLYSRLPYNIPFSIGKDTFFCKIPTAYPVYAPPGFNRYTWSNGTTTDHITVTNSGLYSVKADYECGTLTDSIWITEFQKPDTLLIPFSDTSICSNQSLNITVFNQPTYASYLWSDGSTQDHLITHQPGTYRLLAKTLQGCEVKDSIQITMTYPPLLPSFPDTVLCQGTSLSLVLQPLSGEKIIWYDAVTSFQHDFFSSGNYWVKLYNTCYEQTDTIVIDFQDCTLSIPNLITSNGDGLNDEFKIQTIVPRPLNLTVYNAWGNLVYKEENYTGQWGKEVKEGIYFYQVNDTVLNKNYKGWVQVIK